MMSQEMNEYIEEFLESKKAFELNGVDPLSSGEMVMVHILFQLEKRQKLLWEVLKEVADYQSSSAAMTS